MRLGLSCIFILWASVKTVASYGCGYESLKTSKAMCYMRFHCGEANAKTNKEMLYLCMTYAGKAEVEKAEFEAERYAEFQAERGPEFEEAEMYPEYPAESSPEFLTYFPVCCLHPEIFEDPLYKSTCQQLTKYTASDGGCDPATHKVVKINVGNRPPRPTTKTTNTPARSLNSLNYQISWCPSKIRSSSYLQRYQICCMHPYVYHRYPKECDLLRSKTRIKRQDSESDLISTWMAEDEGVHEVPAEDMPDAPDAGETEIPKMRDAKIEVKCCGSNETTSCRGAECLYVCDNPASDTIVDTLDITSTDDLCDPEIVGEDPTGKRKKRSYSAATMASWKINWCPRYITKNRGRWIKWYKICCFHPNVRKHPMQKNGAAGGVANWCHRKSAVFAAWTG